MTEFEESPFELEEQGELEHAAVAWGLAGFKKLLEADFELDGRTRIGIGKLLHAISCDVRAGNTRRPRILFEIVDPLLEDIAADAEDEILTGLAHEWRGDGATMIRDPVAHEHYNRARTYFEDMSWNDALWRDEPDFMQAYWAIQPFHEHFGGELPVHVDELDFTERIDCKRTFAADFIDSA